MRTQPIAKVGAFFILRVIAIYQQLGLIFRTRVKSDLGMSLTDLDEHERDVSPPITLSIIFSVIRRRTRARSGRNSFLLAIWNWRESSTNGKDEHPAPP